MKLVRKQIIRLLIAATEENYKKISQRKDDRLQYSFSKSITAILFLND
jgi:hypothetical protein